MQTLAQSLQNRLRLEKPFEQRIPTNRPAFHPPTQSLAPKTLGTSTTTTPKMQRVPKRHQICRALLQLQKIQGVQWVFQSQGKGWSAGTRIS